MNSETFKSKKLDHYGLVMAAMDNLEIIKIIDKAMPIKAGAIGHGIAVAAMVMNGLGFIERRLHFNPSFFEDVATEHLFGEGVTASKLNGYKFGRTLDAIGKYDPTRLYAEIVQNLYRINKELPFKFLHIDTTSFSVEGEYKESGESIKDIKITYGHSKDKRPDLKQFILSLTTSGKGRIPIWMEVLSGNSSDKKSIVKSIGKIQKDIVENLKLVDVVYIGDSAMYTKSQLLSPTAQFAWLTRIPNSIRESKELLESDRHNHTWEEVNNNYSCAETINNYEGVDQRWVLIYSKDAYNRDIKSLHAKVKSKIKTIINDITEIQKKIFKSQRELSKGVAAIEKKNSFFDIKVEGTKEVHGNVPGKRGRPQNGTAVTIGFKIERIIFKFSLNKYRKQWRQCGRFIIGTNKIDDKFTSKEMLKEYKNQSDVERGFRFLKDSSFLADEIYLKNVNRIAGLSFVMVLALQVYNAIENHCRFKMEEENATIPNRFGKMTNKPTAKVIFSKFTNINLVQMEGTKKDIASFKRLTKGKGEIKRETRLEKIKKLFLKNKYNTKGSSIFQLFKKLLIKGHNLCLFFILWVSFRLDRPLHPSKQDKILVVAGVKSLQAQIINYFGQEAQMFYGLKTGPPVNLIIS
ncbi:MAG: IS1634 family transposase [Endomicrobium sp.]|jgi:transposase|nr:IS1634 family transposase [Endomicrobium sp.]